MLGSYRQDKVGKLAEVVAATPLAGDIVLASSVTAGDSAVTHDK